jgi:hypothetical protein
MKELKIKPIGHRIAILKSIKQLCKQNGVEIADDQLDRQGELSNQILISHCLFLFKIGRTTNTEVASFLLAHTSK